MLALKLDNELNSVRANDILKINALLTEVGHAILTEVGHKCKRNHKLTESLNVGERTHFVADDQVSKK